VLYKYVGDSIFIIMTIFKSRRSFLAPDILTLGSPATAVTSYELLKSLENKQQKLRKDAERRDAQQRSAFSSRMPQHDAEPGVL
jgi:hypothetical protein